MLWGKWHGYRGESIGKAHIMREWGGVDTLICHPLRVWGLEYVPLNYLVSWESWGITLLCLGCSVPHMGYSVVWMQ